jgi:hypothetical protein
MGDVLHGNVSVNAYDEIEDSKRVHYPKYLYLLVD